VVEVLKKIPQLKVYFPKSKQTKDRVKRLLLWYDPLYRQMKEFQGTRLIFDYVEEKYVEKELGKNISFDEATDEEKIRVKVVKRIRPRVVIDKDTVEVSCKDLLDNWFKTYSNYNLTTAKKERSDSVSTVFEVEKTEVDQFTYDLNRHKFRYQVI
jgi:hypothetical protein